MLVLALFVLLSAGPSRHMLAAAGKSQKALPSNKQSTSTATMDDVNSQFYNPLSPKIPVKARYGLIIDAGSGGSRLHIYSWKARIFHEAPPPITVPEDNEQWTQRMGPGVQIFASNPEEVGRHLQPLMDLAKRQLANYSDIWHHFPVYLKATGGMREVPYEAREILMHHIRLFFYNKTTCPFYFQYDFARVISGEEEAAYSWAAANYLMGTLLPDSVGSGSALATNTTFGTLDLGGASTQIAFFVPSQDVSSGLFKLQIGSQRHWNIYAVSHLQFGINSARMRHYDDMMNKKIAAKGAPSACDGKKNTCEVPTPCLFSGYTEDSTYIDGTGRKLPYTVKGPDQPAKDQMDQCMRAVKPLLMKELNAFCNIVYDRQCSIGGMYQPPLPSNRFVGTSSYKYPWNFAQMDSVGTLEEFYSKSKKICAMTYDEAVEYRNSINESLYDQNGNSAQTDGNMPYYCFLSAYALALLEEGYGFKRTATLQVTNTLQGHKLGWVLGAMLYEINSLPWVYEDPNCPSSESTDGNESIILQESLDNENAEECSDTSFYLHSIPFLITGLLLGFYVAKYCAPWSPFDSVCVEPKPDEEESVGLSSSGKERGGAYYQSIATSDIDTQSNA